MSAGSQRRPLSSKLSTSSYLSQRQIASASSVQANKKDDLLTKEEEYKRLNAELEKKTAHLVFEAEQVLKANEKLLNETDYLDKLAINDDPILQSVMKTNEPIRVENVNLNYDQLVTNEGEADELAESRSELNIIPKVANEMSNEAQIRFLKAKLKVMQEEIEKYGSDLSRKDEENFKLSQRCKELEEDRVKQLRISNSHQTQMEKYKKTSEESQQKVTQLETQAKLLKTENEQLKKDSKKGVQDTQQLELRLNRSLEEIEKLKLELSKQMSSKKDLNEQDKLKIDNLQTENKRLQKQKLELIQAFKKQLKLIDVLKKQKMHLEAAKMLQFSEQEFINALEWNSVTSNAATDAINNPKTNSSRPPSGQVNKNQKLNKQTNQQINRTRSENNGLNDIKNEIFTGGALNANDDNEDDYELEDDMNYFNNNNNNNINEGFENEDNDFND